MIPEEISKVILDVRLNDKTMVDFKNAVTACIIDSCNLNEMQAAICYHWGEISNCSMETIWHSTVRYADFAKSILKNK
jgi:hypothetical protein